MRLVWQLAKGLLAFLILFDVLAIYEVWRHGPSMMMSAESELKNGKVSFTLSPAPLPVPTIVILIALQIVLVAFLWWSKRKAALL